MCDKTNSDIDWNRFQFFQQDYSILHQKELGLPNCLHCGEEPIDITISDAYYCEHRAHIYFRFCYHVVGLVVGVGQSTDK